MALPPPIEHYLCLLTEALELLCVLLSAVALLLLAVVVVSYLLARRYWRSQVGDP